MFDAILARQRQFMAEEGMEALIPFSRENVAYTAGYVVPSQDIPIRRRVFPCVVTASGREAMLTVDVEEGEARERSRIKDIRPYNQFTDDPMKVLASLLREMGLERARIGLEMDAVPALHFLSLQRELPGAEFVGADRLFDRLRMVKTEEEIGYLRQAAGAAHQAHRAAHAAIREGDTEQDFARKMLDAALAAGADEVIRLVVGSGHRSVFGNCAPTSKRLQAGEMVKVDVFVRKNGYYSDVARNVVVGRASRYQAEVWRKLVEAHDHVRELIRPGASSREIFESFRRKFAALGLEPGINFVGHGIGLTLHEYPYIDRYTDTVLQEGMVLCLEPVYIADGMCFHLEDELVVTKDGSDLLTDGRNGGRIVELA